MAIYIDRRLIEKINMAGQTGQVDAVIVVRESDELSPSLDDGGSARQVIDSAVERTGEFPYAVRYFPRANAAVISASVKLIEEIVKDDDLAIVSAPDVDAIIFD